MLRKLKFILVPRLLKLLTSLITATCKVRWHNDAAYRQQLKSGQPFVAAMWHNCSTIGAWAMQGSGITVMVSDSKDGEYVSRYAGLYGIETIRGSSSKGAKKAIRAGLAVLAAGKPLAVTPDGPRGPKYLVQSGTLWFAAAAQVPIIPLHIEASRQWVMSSWDGHRFPKPFSTIHIGVGEILHISRSQLLDNADSAIDRVRKAMLDNVRYVQGRAQPGGEPPSGDPY
ncbi:MAG: lysophospholipid acyltransferase family protein [Gammaproteobacteria bacterium]|nr:lysophospholipid acyltransferase family protein [Gammaproteobacteria bacterium]